MNEGATPHTSGLNLAAHPPKPGRPAGKPPGAPPPAPHAPLPRPAKRLHPRDALFRGAVFLVLLASVGLAWWTLMHRLIPVQKESRQLSKDVDRLSSQVDTLQRKWTAAKADEVQAGYKQAHRALFADETAMGAWIEHFEEQSTPLAMSFKVAFGTGRDQTNAPEKLVLIPATVSIDVRPAAEGLPSAYQRLLRLDRQLATEAKRADLVEMTISGGPGSVTRAALVFSLWAGEDTERPGATGGGK